MLENKEQKSEIKNESEKTIIESVPFFKQEITKDSYQENGFDSYEEAKHWENRSCGIVCLKMIIKALKPELTPTTKELLEIGLKKHAYEERKGWIHKGLIEIGKEYGLEGNRESVGEDIEKIKKHILNKQLVIASVSHGFEVGKKYKLEDESIYIVPKGGHLVVIFGVEEKNNLVDKLFLHHPSSYKDYEWPNYEISKDVFLKSFSEAGNIIYFGKE
jgi:hypothetical protein